MEHECLNVSVPFLSDMCGTPDTYTFLFRHKLDLKLSDFENRKIYVLRS